MKILKKIPFALMLLSALFWQSCTKQKHLEVKDANYNINMAFPKKMYSEKGDSLFVYFKVMDTITNKKVKFEGLSENIDTLTILEVGNRAKTIEGNCKITRIGQSAGNQQDLVDTNNIFWLLIDRSSDIPQTQLDLIKEAVEKTLEKLPYSTVYISFVDNLDRIQINKKDDFKKIVEDNGFERKTGENKLLFSKIIEQFSNFAEFAEKPVNKGKDCYFLVCTNGGFDGTNDREAIVKMAAMAANNNVSTRVFRYGQKVGASDNKESIEFIQNNLNAQLYSINDAAAVSDTIASFISNELSYDYLITFVRSISNGYIGQDLSLDVYIKKDNKKMYGKIEKYNIGSPMKPVGESPVNFFISIFLAIFVIIILYFIIQVAIPYFISKRENFKEKYVKPYKFAEKVQMEDCTWCGEPFEDGDEVVEKCLHKSHYYCWEEHGYHCIEYGRYCKDGIEHHFDKKHAFDLKTGPFYRKWAIAGAISGLIISIVDYWILRFVLVFKGLSEFMVNKIYLTSNYEKIIIDGKEKMGIPVHIFETFCVKIQGFLMAGILLGFTLTFLFTWINEFRSKKGRVLWSMIGRSIIGAATGFTAFFIGSVICILFGKAGAGIAPYIDWIPWILFGLGISLCLSIKTTIKTKDAVIGGLISGVVSFACLFSSYIFSPFGMFLSFMLCSAGIGISIVAKHYMAQKYFLKYTHKNKSGEIAIHKWMNESGGRNAVTIGKSVHSIIQINWANEDEKEKIHDIQTKLYIDKKHNKPCIVALEEGMQLDGRDAKVNMPNVLENGKTFIIGETKFEYIEK